ncbi:MAG: tetratricopeptide repeat protein [Kiritimatiellae bacterium]|nr:tetratricopeptide repeat protein [Kiritimatiellia bacterium]
MPATWRRDILLGAALILITFAVFGPVVRYGFAGYDDDYQVLDNLLIRSLRPAAIGRMFSSWSVRSYYPMRVLSLAVDYACWGKNPHGYHLTNLLLHAANVLLVFRLSARLARLADGQAARVGARCAVAGFVAASLFAVHPVVVEPVAWIAGREELLAGFWVLCSVLAFANAEGRAGAGAAAWRRRVAAAAASFVACVLACMSNVIGAVTPALLTAYAVLAAPRREGALWRRSLHAIRVLWYFWLPAVGALVLKVVGNRLSGPRGDRMLDLPITAAERLRVVLSTYGLNVKTLVWPAGLVIPYPNVVPARVLAPHVLLGFAAVLGTVLLMVHVRARRAAVFGLAWFLVALAPAAQLAPHHIFRADRFLYLPLAGIALAAGAAAVRAAGSRRTVRIALMALGCAALAGYAVRAAHQRRVWQGAETLFRHTLNEVPASYAARISLGNVLMAQGRHEEAFTHYRAATRIDPETPDAFTNLGVLMDGQGRTRAALAFYRRALQLDPDNAVLKNNIAWLLATAADARIRDPANAVAMAESACRSAPARDPDMLDVLAAAYAAAGRYADAVRVAREAMDLASQLGRGELTEKLRARLALYGRHQPYVRESREERGARSAD